MHIVERVRRLLLAPDAEWMVIASERASMGTLLTGYVLPLAALSALGSLLGTMFAGFGVAFALRVAILGLVMTVFGVLLLSAIIDALAPTFGAVKSRESAVKVAAYAPTPAWVAGIFQVIPLLGTVVVVVGVLYALYLLYLGLMHVMKSPGDRAIAYTVLVVVISIVVSFVVSYLTATTAVAPTMSTF